DRTYAGYQHPRGFLVSGTGWDSECDLAPSTGWQSHDFRALVHRHGVDDTFWDKFFTDDDCIAVLLGEQCMWIERGARWAIGDDLWQGVFNLVGRKDRVTFGPNLPDWVAGGWHAPKDYAIPDRPVVLKTDDAIKLWSGDWA